MITHLTRSGLLLAFYLTGCQHERAATQRHPTNGPMNLTITSSAFGNGEAIPARYTCDGQNVSPPLQWSGVPPTSKSLVLIVDDPDAPDPQAPKMTWVHWLLYNLPPSSNSLVEGITAAQLPAGSREGKNDWKRLGYGGPCPPIGRHRYYHKIFALDVTLPDLKQPTKAALEKAMEGHIVGRGEVIGTYQRTGS
jgi:Raf kinase inhibitor-like YbhB/YbcL family protein